MAHILQFEKHWPSELFSHFFFLVISFGICRLLYLCKEKTNSIELPFHPTHELLCGLWCQASLWCYLVPSCKTNIYWVCTLGTCDPVPGASRHAGRLVLSSWRKDTTTQSRQVLGQRVTHAWSAVSSLEAVRWSVKATERTGLSRERKQGEQEARRCLELFSAEVGSHWWFLSQVVIRPGEGFGKVSLANPFQWIKQTNAPALMELIF